MAVGLVVVLVLFVVHLIYQFLLLIFDLFCYLVEGLR